MTRTTLLRPYTTVEGVHPLIAGRWSSRAIDKDKRVDEARMTRLYEAARWAPSAMNRQPWRIMSFSSANREEMEKAQSTLNRGNAWALQAPRLLFFLAVLEDPAEETVYPRAEYETGMAASQMALQAAHEGLVFHQMAGFDRDKLIDLFSLEPQFKPITAVVLGFPGFIEEVPEHRRNLETAPRDRKALKDILFLDGTVPR